MLGRILVFLGGLLVVALFGALLAPLFVDWTDFRKDFESQASRILGKKVTVLGEVNARLLPFPSVTLHDVTVGADKDGKPLVHVARFSMDAELAPLLSGEARIFDMRIEEPKARIRLLPDGTLDWLRGSSADIPARTVVLENVRVVGGEIDFIDEQTGRTRRLTGLDADMSARSLAGPWSVDGSAALDGEKGIFHLSSLQPEVGADAISLKLRLQPESRPFTIELDGDLTLKTGKPSYQGQFQATWKGKEPDRADPKTPPPRAKGAFELTNERIALTSYRFEIGEATDPYVVTGEAKLDTGVNPEFLLTAEGQQVDVNRLANESAKGKTGRNAAGSVRERLDLLIAMASEIPIPNLPGKATLRLPAIVAGDTVLRDITLDIRPDGRGWNVERAVVVLPGRTQVEAKGRLTLGSAPAFSGDLLVASTQPSGLSTWVSGSVDPAIRQLKSMGFSAAVNLTPQIQRFEKLELALGPALLNGRLERQSLDNAVATLSIDLAGNEIDLDAARAVASLIAGEEASQGLLAEKIATRLKVGRLTGYGVEARGVETIFTYDGASVVVDRLNVEDLAGATLKASGTVKGPMTTPSGKAQVALSAADPGPFLTLISERLPAHPLAGRLVKSARWYADSNLTASLVFGEAAGGGMAVKVAGTSNGSRVALDYGVSDLARLSSDAKVNLAATLENPQAQVLLGQAGLDPLPIGGGEGGRLQFSVTGAGDAPADAVLTFAAGRTTLSARGVLYQVAEAVGTLAVVHVRAQLDALGPADRKALARLGLRFGTESVFLPGLLTAEAIRLRAILWATRRGVGTPPVPVGRMSFAPLPEVETGFYGAIGYRLAGGVAVRVDVLERFAAEVRAAVREAKDGRAAKDGATLLPPALLSGIGVSAADAGGVLETLGFMVESSEAGLIVRPRRRPARKIKPAAKPAATRRPVRPVRADSPFAVLEGLAVRATEPPATPVKARRRKRKQA